MVHVFVTVPDWVFVAAVGSLDCANVVLLALNCLHELVWLCFRQTPLLHEHIGDYRRRKLLLRLLVRILPEGQRFNDWMEANRLVEQTRLHKPGFLGVGLDRVRQIDNHFAIRGLR